MAIAIVAAAAPFAYVQVADSSREIRDIVAARQIISCRGPMLNFLRMNAGAQGEIDDVGEICAAAPSAAFIDGREVYLAFKTGGALQGARIAKHIGADVGIAGADRIAYDIGGAWGVSSEKFNLGDLVYRISASWDGADTAKYLHKAGDEEHRFNQMQRDLNMSGNDLLDAGSAGGKILAAGAGRASFLLAKIASATELFFADGADIQPSKSRFGFIRVNGDTAGFRNISAANLTANKIIADRASFSKAIRVTENMDVQASSLRTISAFETIAGHSAYVSYANIANLFFAPTFGITIGAELMFGSGKPPLKIGNWSFPSSNAPKFSELVLDGRHVEMSAPAGFDKIMESGWKEIGN